MIEEKEIWKDIDEFHQVSNIGRVRSLDKYTVDTIGRLQFHKGKVMKQKKDKDGYLIVPLGKTTFRVHRLVAEAFIPNPHNLPYVNHKDENPSNNFVYVNTDGTVDIEKSNLEWCDAKYNANYGTKIERSKMHTDWKAAAKKRKKTILQFDIDGNYIREFESIKEASELLCIDASSITHHLKGTRHKKQAGGFIWKYKNN